jgi:hypothetical protein
MITFADVVQRLQERAIPYGTLALADRISLVICQRGGRILGPFQLPEGESLLWANPAFGERGAFGAFLAADGWNLGGERIWVAPEIQYGVRDRRDFWRTLALPPQMDPGDWKLAQDGDTYTLTQALTLEAHNIAHGHKTLHIARRIRPAADPLRALSGYAELTDGVTFAGYEHDVTLTETQTDEIMSETWSVMQLRPEGQLFIPATPVLEYSDYFEPIDAAYQTIDEHGARLRITGDRRYKVGYKAAHLFGRLGYAGRLVDGRTYLIVRTFFNNPSAPYTEEPPDQVGCRGHSVHVYNDGGMFGGFGELECNGQTIGGSTGRSSSTDPFITWFYLGPRDKIAVIATHLLRRGLEEHAP